MANHKLFLCILLLALVPAGLFAGGAGETALLTEREALPAVRLAAAPAGGPFPGPVPGEIGDWAEMWAEVWAQAWAEAWARAWDDLGPYGRARAVREGARIALVPFWGEDADIVALFGQELFNAINEIEGFVPVRVDTASLPPYIPAGGFPPHISPSTSVAGDAPFAITGNVRFIAAVGWHMRLYLWRVSEPRPVFHDELVVADIESLRDILPSMLGWLTWVDEEALGRQIEAARYAEAPGRIWEMPGHSMFYVGLGAGWNAQIFDPWPRAEELEVHMANMGASLSFYFQALSFSSFNWPSLFFFLGPQLEAAFLMNTTRETSAVAVPLSLRLAARWNDWFVSPLAGAYVLFGGDELFENLPWGISLGLGFGRRLGAGYLNFGLRWSNDMFSIEKERSSYNRHTVSVSVGYEFGLVRRGSGERQGRRERRAAEAADGRQ